MSDNPVLDRLGLTELQLQEMMARSRNRPKQFVVVVPVAVECRAQEIHHLLRTGEITNAQGAAMWADTVQPYIKLRPGTDYNPNRDIITLIPARAPRAGGIAVPS